MFVAGKQGEFFSLSVAERKRLFDIAVDTLRGRGGAILSCSDQNMDVVLELGRHAQSIGAEFIVVHAPVLHFVHDRDDLLFEYYRTLSEELDIGIALWSHPDSGYVMSLSCARGSPSCRISWRSNTACHGRCTSNSRIWRATG